VTARPDLSPGDWTALSKIASGSELEIETKDGKRAKGRLSGVSDAGITIDRKGAAVTIDPPGGREVYHLSKKSWAQHLLIGGGLGAASGLGAAAALLGATGGSDEGGMFLSVGIGIGAIGGAAIGAVTAIGKRHNLIYEAGS